MTAALVRLADALTFKSRTVSTGVWLITVATWALFTGKIEANHWESVAISCLFVIAGRTVALPMVARVSAKKTGKVPTNDELAAED